MDFNDTEGINNRLLNIYEEFPIRKFKKIHPIMRA